MNDPQVHRVKKRNQYSNVAIFRSLFGCLMANVVSCFNQYINVNNARDQNFTKSLDYYPVASFSSSNITECNQCCIFQPSSFSTYQAFLVQIGDDFDTEDPFMFVNGLLIRHVQNSTLATWLSGENKYFSTVLVDPSKGNYDVTDRINSTYSSWSLLGDDTPNQAELFELEIARTNSPPGTQYYILTNNGTAESPRHYMIIFAVDILSTTIIANSIVKNYTFSADYGVRSMYRPNLFAYVDQNTINFGSLDLSTGIIATTLNYNLTTLDLAMKDYYVCNDSSSVVVVENHRGTDIISLTQIANFMNGAKTWLTGANTTLFVSSQGGLVVSIYNQGTSMYELYYLTGNDYNSYNLVQIYANGTYQVRNAEENNALVMFSDTHGLMYYYFKAIKYLAIMDYSVISGQDIRGYLYNDTNSADLLNLFTFVNFGPYGPPGPDRVYPELVRFNFSTTNDSIPEINCHFTNPMGQYSTLNISTLLTNYTITIQWQDDDQQQQMSGLIKNVLITGTVILTMLLILGSFWLMSRKSKEEDAALEEFKLDYIKYSHKKPEHDDSSSLIEHDIN